MNMIIAGTLFVTSAGKRNIAQFLVFALLWGASLPAPAPGNQSANADSARPSFFLNTGHWAAVNALAISPDGKLAASGSDDGTVKLIDALTGIVRLEIPAAPSGYVFSVSWSPDGNRLVVGSTYNVISLWDTRTGEHLSSWSEPGAWVTGVAFNADGTLIASCDYEGGVFVWDARRATVLARHPASDVKTVYWSPDGKSLAAYGRMGFKVWRDSGWKIQPAPPVRPLRGWPVDDHAVIDVAWARSGGEVAMGSENIVLTDLQGITRKTIAWKKRVTALAWSPDARLLAVGGYGNAAIVNPADGSIVATFYVGHAPVKSLAWGKDGKRVAVGDESGRITLWSVSKSAPLADLSSQINYPVKLAWGHADRLFVFGGRGGSLFDTQRGGVIATTAPLHSASWCGDTLLGVGDSGLTWWNGRSGVACGVRPRLTKALSIVGSPDKSRALLYGEGLEVWDVRRGEGRELPDIRQLIRAAAWSPDGGRIVLGFRESLELWTLGKTKPARLRKREGGSSVAAWKPGAEIIVAQGPKRHSKELNIDMAGLVALQSANLARKEWIQNCYVGTYQPCDYQEAAWSPDGNLLAVVVDRELEIIDKRPGTRRAANPVPIPNVAVYHAAWNRDGSVIAASLWNSSVMLIRIKDGAVLRIRQVRIGEKTFGLAEDEKGCFDGDKEACACVVPNPLAGKSSAVPPASLRPNLMKDFLAGTRP